MIDLFPDLSARSNEPEIMDDMLSDEKKLINTIKQFTLLNLLFTNSRGLIKKYILSDMISNRGKKFTLLDIGAGGCDVSIWIVMQCRKLKIDLKITCLDNDRRITNYSRNKCRDIKEITILEADAFDLEKLDGFDYVFANHFLHHFKADAIAELLKIIHEKTGRVYLLNDIYRSNLIYLGCTFFTGIFMHNSFVFYDGRLSIKRGFVEKELDEILKKSKLQDKARIIKALPSRICILGKKN